MATQTEVQVPTAVVIDSRVSKNVTANLVFLKKDARHEKEVPYKLHYNPPPEIERQNFDLESRGPIIICDLRGRSDLPFEKTGFEVLKLEDSHMAREDFYDEAKIKRVYYEELKDALIKRFSGQGAARVEVLEHLVRRRHPNFPKSTGTDYVHEQPTSVVHIDYTLFSAVESSRELLGLAPENFNRVLAVNAWKPLKGPLTDWPLAVCDARTVEKSDLVAADIVRRTVFTENYQVYYNEKQKWWYLSEQRSDEVMVFCQAESGARAKGYFGVPHTGFDNIFTNENEHPRESIEARAFIYF